MKQILLLFISFCLLLACSQKQPETNSSSSANINMTVADSAMVESSLQKQGYAKGRKFIRTADMEFRVNNVQKATNRIEDLAMANGGMVTSVNLTSTVQDTDETDVSADSTVVITSYVTRNDLIIRVPNTRLDTLIRSLQPLITFLNYRKISAEDASLTLAANAQKSKLLADYNKRTKQKIDEKGIRLPDIGTAEDNRLNRQLENLDAQTESRKLNDLVNYSKLELHIYQHPSVSKTLVANTKNIEALRPNLFLRIWESFRIGWHVFEEILVFLMRFWFLWLIIGMGYYWFKRKKGNL